MAMISCICFLLINNEYGKVTNGDFILKRVILFPAHNCRITFFADNLNMVGFRASKLCFTSYNVIILLRLVVLFDSLTQK